MHAQRRFQRQPRRSHMLSPRPRTMKHTSLIRANDDTAPLPTGRVFDGDRRDGLPSLGSVDLESVSSKSRSASAEALQSASQSASGASASPPLEELKLPYVGWWLVVGHGGPSLGAENSSLESLSSADISVPAGHRSNTAVRVTPHQFGQDRTGSLSPCFGSISGVSWVTKQEDHSLKIHKMPRQPTLGLINCAPNPTWRPRDLVRGRDQLYRNTRSSQDSVHAPGSQGAVSGSTGHPR